MKPCTCDGMYHSIFLLAHWGRDKMATNFQTIFLNENVWISIRISLKFVLQFPLNNEPALVQIKAWHLNRWQAIIWTNDGLFHWRIYASIGFSELNTKTNNCTSPVNKFCLNLGVSGLEFTDCYKMMHIACSRRGEVPYCFSRSSVKFQGPTWQKMLIFTRIGCFPIVTPVWIHWWL